MRADRKPLCIGVSLFSCVALATGATGAEPPAREGPQPVRPGDHGIGRRVGDLAFTDLAGAAQSLGKARRGPERGVRMHEHELPDQPKLRRISRRTPTGSPASRQLIQAAQNVVPVAATAGNKIASLRQWASSRCLSAGRSGGGVFAVGRERWRSGAEGRAGAGGELSGLSCGR
jgi:hypothetical protein